MKTVNITFSKLIKIDNRQWEVNFRKVPGANQFHVDTATLQGERIQFNLFLDGSSEWKIVGQDVPDLIAGAREKLATAVEKGMVEYYPEFAPSIFSTGGPTHSA